MAPLPQFVKHQSLNEIICLPRINGPVMTADNSRLHGIIPLHGRQPALQLRKLNTDPDGGRPAPYIRIQGSHGKQKGVVPILPANPQGIIIMRLPHILPELLQRMLVIAVIQIIEQFRRHIPLKTAHGLGIIKIDKHVTDKILRHGKRLQIIVQIIQLHLILRPKPRLHLGNSLNPCIHSQPGRDFLDIADLLVQVPLNHLQQIVIHPLRLPPNHLAAVTIDHRRCRNRNHQHSQVGKKHLYVYLGFPLHKTPFPSFLSIQWLCDYHFTKYMGNLQSIWEFCLWIAGFAHCI